MKRVFKDPQKQAAKIHLYSLLASTFVALAITFLFIYVGCRVIWG